MNTIATGSTLLVHRVQQRQWHVSIYFLVSLRFQTAYRGMTSGIMPSIENGSLQDVFLGFSFGLDSTILVASTIEKDLVYDSISEIMIEMIRHHMQADYNKPIG